MHAFIHIIRACLCAHFNVYAYTHAYALNCVHVQWRPLSDAEIDKTLLANPDDKSMVYICCLKRYTEVSCSLFLLLLILILLILLIRCLHNDCDCDK